MFKLRKVVIFLALGLYFLLCFYMYMVQEELLYYPIQSSFIEKDKWKPIVNNNMTIGLESIKKSNKVIVLFHGNAGNASMRTYYLNFFPKEYQIVIAEYPGFGMNSQALISKENIISDARKLIDTIRLRNPKEIILVGESLGTGIASQMANEYNINKLLLFTPYSKISDVAQDRYWFLPVNLLIKDDYDSIDNLKNYQGKTFLLISENDQTIPTKFAFKLFDSITAPKEKIVVSNAGHSNWMKYITENQTEELKSFLKTK